MTDQIRRLQIGGEAAGNAGVLMKQSPGSPASWDLKVYEVLDITPPPLQTT